MPPHPPLHAAPISHTMAIPHSSADAAIEPDYLALPDAPAVCIFESPERHTLLLATTASARDLARRRLGTLPAEERSSRADLRAICGHVHAIRVGSSLEADAVYLHQARERLPELAKVVAERWRAWFVHVDPDAEFPQWTKTNLMVGLVGKRSASTAIGGGTMPPGVLIGPLPDKDAAGRLIETIIDTFDLCRFHNLLVQAPKAAACAYKEMGRCPAPCDGSEEMSDYRTRTGAACSSAIDRTHARMLTEGTLRDLVAGEKFEDAAATQRLLKRLEALDKPAFVQLRTLHEWTELLVLPGARKEIATIALFHRGSLTRVGDLDTRAAGVESEAQRIASETSEWLGTPARASDDRAAARLLALDEQAIETIAITARWLFTPKAKRRGAVIPLVGRRFDHAALLAAAGTMARAKAAPIEVETHEIEGGG